MTEVLLDTLLDTLKLLPFLFLTYLLMEFIEHKTSDKTEETIRRAGKFGPVLGGILGIVPQCGFSASASSLYSGRIISLGTLVAIFLSTSDEMLPVCISEKVNWSVIAEILIIKMAVGIIVGLAVDLIIRISRKEEKPVEIHSICEHDHCHCEDGIAKSALIHTAQIIAFIFVISLVLNTVIWFVGEDKIGKIFLNIPVLGCAASALVGLIPNCAASVVITELYLAGVISSGAMLSGLLTGCGIGLLVLFRTNKNVKENLKITAIMYFSGVIIGSVAELIGLSF